MIQEIHTHSCRRCGSQALHRNGSVKGKAKYHCTTCGYHGYFTSALEQRQARYAQVEKLLSERLSQRAIVRATGVSRMTVAKILKKSVFPPSTDGSGQRG